MSCSLRRPRRGPATSVTQPRDHHDGWGPLALARALFSSHSHDVGDSLDLALEASRRGIRALKLSLSGLMLTALLQMLIVLFTNSVALLADTFHNFTDALTAVPLWIAFTLSRRTPTRHFTHGYGRAEDLAGIFIVATIALSAGIAAWESVQRLVAPREVANVPWVVVAGVIGFAGNELVALYRIRVGRRIGSAALVADGLHARVDGLTSLAVVVGAVGVATGFPLADPIVGVLISVAILFVLKEAAGDIYHRMMDGVDPALVDRVEGLLLSSQGIEGVDGLRLRWLGHELRAEAEVVSDGELSLTEAHAIAERARHRLFHEVPRLTQAIIHTSPPTVEGRNPHADVAHHLARPKAG